MTHESWQTSPFLPDGWLFKIAWEGQARTKMQLQTNTWFLSREGCHFESMKSAIEFMESAEGYSYKDVKGCKIFQINQRKTKAKLKFDWEEGDESLPAGWFKRVAEGNAQMEYILSPEGEQFKTRFSAIQNMFKTNVDPLVIEEMREKLTFEGWERIALLPTGWMFKRAWEGTDTRGRMLSNTHYLSKEGNVFESAKTATEFMESAGEYTEQDSANLKDFQNMLCKVTNKKRDDWEEDEETLPQGWKKRVTSKMEYFLRPDGKQFKSRCIALQTMAKDGYDSGDIEEMRSKLCHEGWKNDKMLPKGWLYKKWEGIIKDKLESSYQYLSVECVVYSSMKTVVKFMQESGEYSEEEIRKCQKFVKKENRSSINSRFNWSEDSQLPPGWKSRIADGAEGRRYVLMPDGNQFPSLFSAFQFMVKEKYEPEDTDEMRKCLKQEGWEYDPMLPSGWQCRISKDKNLYLGRLGEYFTSAKKAYEFLVESSDYTMEDADGVKDKMEQETKSKVPDKYNWKEYESLPTGWKIRKMKNKCHKMVEYFLAPDGKHIRGRNSSMEYMDKHGYGQEDILKIKAFRWFGNSQIKQEIKAEVPMEEDSSDNSNVQDHIEQIQEFDESLEERRLQNDHIETDNSLNTNESLDEDVPIVTSTTDDEVEPSVSSSDQPDANCDEEDESPGSDVMAEFLDKITSKMTTMDGVTSNAALMQDINKTLSDLKNSLVQAGRKRPAPALPGSEESNKSKRRSVH